MGGDPVKDESEITSFLELRCWSPSGSARPTHDHCGTGSSVTQLPDIHNAHKIKSQAHITAVP